MQRVNSSRALDICVKERWLRIAVYSIIGGLVGGILWAFLFAILYVFAECFVMMNLYLVCNNNFGARICGEMVRRSKNFCPKCGSKIPDNLKGFSQPPSDQSS